MLRVLRPSPGERLNTLTHGAGFALSIVGAVVLMRQVWPFGEFWRYLGGGLYALSLVGVYASSTLSHSASEPNAKRLFRMFDQAFIYLLIVGSYTPFALAYLRSSVWWMVFLGVLWALALFGFFSKVVAAHRVDSVSIWIYLLLGWLPVTSVYPIMQVAPSTSLKFMLAGGMCYTIGTLFLMYDQRVPRFHAVWHVLVIAGSVFHFWGILPVIGERM